MPLSHTSSKNGVAIDRPKCPECGSAMWLRHIAHSPDGGVELQTFECPVCEISTGDGSAEGGPPPPPRR